MDTKKKFLITLFVTSFSLVIAQSSQEGLIGKEIKELEFNPILNFKKDKSLLSDFHGKVVVLDFWATWCSPCIKEFPRLQEMQNKFKDDIIVLTINKGEEEERLNKFLSTSKIELPIVMDKDHNLSKAFPHRFIPHTVVIGKDQKIKAITDSKNVTKELIEMVLNDQKIELKEKRANFSWNRNDNLQAKDAIVQFTITKYNGGSYVMTPFKEGRILINGTNQRFLFEYAYDFPPYTRTVIDAPDKNKADSILINELYSAEIIALGKTESEVKAMLKAFLVITSPYEATIESRAVNVKVLRRNGVLNLKKGELHDKGEFWFSGRGLHTKNRPIDEKFMRFFENQLAEKDKITVVLNETGLKGNYSVDIPWYSENPDNIHKELSKLGLELVDATREVDLLVISRKKTLVSR